MKKTPAYPAPGLELIFSKTGNFIIVAGLWEQRRWVDEITERLAAAMTVPATMITDRAFHRHHNYHQPTDTPDTLDYNRMLEVVKGQWKLVLHSFRPARKGACRRPRFLPIREAENDGQNTGAGQKAAGAGKGMLMKKELSTWIRQVQGMAGDNLVSVILYGSNAHKQTQEIKTDLNLMLVCKDISMEEIARINASAQKILGAFTPRLVFWSEEELKNAWDVFPVEFADIRENHECLAGRDPVKRRKPEKKHLRCQLEFELRSKLLNMRNVYLQLHQDGNALRLYLEQAGKSFQYLFATAARYFPGLKNAGQDVFKKTGMLRNRAMRISRQECDQIFKQLHAAVTAAVRIIDAA